MSHENNLVRIGYSLKEDKSPNERINRHWKAARSSASCSAAEA
jgi:hypothetical protein